MNPRKRQVGIRWMVALALGLTAAPAFAEWVLNMPEGVTPTGRDVYGLHMTIVWICVAIGVLVFGAMLFSIVQHRKSRGVKPAQFHHSTAIEIVWTVIPLAILISMAVPATSVLIDMEDTSGADMTVKVTGYQWKWEYEYLDEGIRFFSNLDADSNAARQMGAAVAPSSVDNYLLEVDRPLVVPTNTRIRILITSNDVIHSWWVPELGWKKDAIPGYVNAAWTEIDEPGI
ncbi:cytochrome c oxidase subunit II, partial [Schnuerera sp.]|uniref:cytochrome c oxidase subunit II n=1 Tax=Schnuerera sp. TaxID=2794844 RepID=UPI002CE13C15